MILAMPEINEWTFAVEHLPKHYINQCSTFWEGIRVGFRSCEAKKL